MPRKTISLSQWIETVGVSQLSTDLGVSRSVVSKWKSKCRFPDSRNLFLLINMSQGRVSFDRAFADWFDANPKQLRAKAQSK